MAKGCPREVNDGLCVHSSFERTQDCATGSGVFILSSSFTRCRCISMVICLYGNTLMVIVHFNGLMETQVRFFAV